MNQVSQIISFMSEPSNALPVLVSLAAFLLVVSSILAAQWVSSRSRVKRSIGIEEVSISDKVVEIVKPVSEYVLPKGEEGIDAQSRLVQAGFRDPNAVTILYIVRTLLLLIVPLGVLASNFWLQLPIVKLGMFVAAAFGVGLIAPGYYLHKRIEARKRALLSGFPDALDLLVVCTEAGLSLSSALQRVSEEIQLSHPDLSTELSIVTAEIKAGLDKDMALRNLATRTKLKDIKGLVAVISQSMKFGTGVADSLRVFAEEFRDKRTQRAEEAAAKIGTMMIFPLITCLWPGFFVVAVGPAVLGLIKVFGHGGLMHH